MFIINWEERGVRNHIDEEVWFRRGLFIVGELACLYFLMLIQAIHAPKTVEAGARNFSW